MLLYHNKKRAMGGCPWRAPPASCLTVIKAKLTRDYEVSLQRGDFKRNRLF
jgi:hypothetical protein